MDDAVQNEDLLQRYLDGELTAAEKEAVEHRLQRDEAFRNRLTDLRVAVEAIRHLGTMQQVQSVHREMMQELKGHKVGGRLFSFSSVIRYTLGVAASVVALVAGIRLYQRAQLSPERLYNETFVEFDVSATRGAEDRISATEALYQQKAYSRITALVQPFPLSAKDSLLTGLSYLHQDSLTAAASWLTSLMNTGSEYQPDAAFYLGLIYLKKEEYQRALSLMQNIYNDPAHLYQQQVSAELITKLRKLAHTYTD